MQKICLDKFGIQDGLSSRSRVEARVFSIVTFDYHLVLSITGYCQLVSSVESFLFAIILYY